MQYGLLGMQKKCSSIVMHHAFIVVIVFNKYKCNDCRSAYSMNKPIVSSNRRMRNLKAQTGYIQFRR